MFLLRLNIDVENHFDNYVTDFGGKKISDLIGKSPDFENADYLFYEYKVVAELKCLEEDKGKDVNIQHKINKKYEEWKKESIVPPLGNGVSKINTRDLPPECQLDIIKIFEKPFY